MKIVAVLGSPRPGGNSSTLARRVVETARDLGAEVEIHQLNSMDIKGCQGCDSCKTKSDRCVVEDDLAPVYDAIRVADVLLMASPVYFGEISGQLKCFFDRFYAFANPDFTSRLAPGKKTVFVLTQAGPEAMYDDIHGRYERWLKMLGFEPNYLVRACLVREAGEVKNRPEALAQAEEAAVRLMGK